MVHNVCIWYVRLCVSVQLCACIWRSKQETRCLSPLLFTTVPWSRVSHWTGSSILWLNWLTSMGPSGLDPQWWGLRCRQASSDFQVCAGHLKLSLYLGSTSTLTVSPNPKGMFIKIDGDSRMDLSPITESSKWLSLIIQHENENHTYEKNSTTEQTWKASRQE